ncbi:MAG: hypothetical protein V4496_04330 [Pseudomonadota bacterium]
MLGFNYNIATAKTPEQLNACFPPGHDVNTLCRGGAQGNRYIDWAASIGNVEVFKALVHQHHANIEKVPDCKHTNLFYSMSRCLNQEARRALFEWLQEDRRYEQLNCGVTALHLKAVLEKGETFLSQLNLISAEIEDSIVDTLLDYYIAANTVDVSVEKRIEQVLKEFPDKYSLVILSFLLLQFRFPAFEESMEQAKNLIAQIKKLKTATLDFGISLTDENHPLCYVTLAEALTDDNAISSDTSVSGYIAEELAALYQVDLNAKAGDRTFAFELLCQTEGDEILTIWIDRYPQTLDLKGHWGEDDSPSLAYQLAALDLYEILSEQIDRSAEVINLNAGQMGWGWVERDTLASVLIEYQRWGLLNKIAHKNQYKCCGILLTSPLFERLIKNNQHALIGAVMSDPETSLPIGNTQAIALILNNPESQQQSNEAIVGKYIAKTGTEITEFKHVPDELKFFVLQYWIEFYSMMLKNQIENSLPEIHQLFGQFHQWQNEAAKALLGESLGYLLGSVKLDSHTYPAFLHLYNTYGSYGYHALLDVSDKMGLETAMLVSKDAKIMINIMAGRISQKNEEILMHTKIAGYRKSFEDVLTLKQFNQIACQENALEIFEILGKDLHSLSEDFDDRLCRCMAQLAVAKNTNISRQGVFGGSSEKTVIAALKPEL